MPEYSANDFLRMQQDAMARVREMQKRAKAAVGRQEEPIREEVPAVIPEILHNPHKQPQEKQPKGPYCPIDTGNRKVNIPFLKNLDIDRDVLLILAVALILMSEETDIMLLLALGYILL